MQASLKQIAKHEEDKHLPVFQLSEEVKEPDGVENFVVAVSLFCVAVFCVGVVGIFAVVSENTMFYYIVIFSLLTCYTTIIVLRNICLSDQLLVFF